MPLVVYNSGMNKQWQEQFVWKKIAILGFGKEWQSTLRFLERVWIEREQITVLDQTTGDNYLDDLGQYDVIIKSPWISPYHQKISPYRDKITSQTELFCKYYQWKIIGVTATKGKSTICSLIYSLLKQAWLSVKLVGNIGNPVLDEVDLLLWEQFDYVVYEMSSYMLDWFKPKLFMGILGNLYEDHLDRHHGVQNYHLAKLNILDHSDHMFVHQSLQSRLLKDANMRPYGGVAYYGQWTTYQFDESVPITLLGDHNKENASLLYAIADLVNIQKFVVDETISSFEWLPHRLQHVGTVQWIDRYDDAISTTPESTIAAIQALGDRVQTIFLWWTDRWYDFSVLLSVLVDSSIKNIVLFPESWKRIKDWLSEYHERFVMIESESMSEAVQFALDKTASWHACLLSCASPSYSLWKSYEEKGDEFQKEVKELEK